MTAAPISRRRALLGAAASLAVPTIPRFALAQDQPKVAGEVDMFAYLIAKEGEPQHARKLDPADAGRYSDRVPQALIRFWIEHGRGSYFDGLYWICEPEPFDAVLDLIFEGDAEFGAPDMAVVAYDAFGRLKVWHRHLRHMNVFMMDSSVFNPTEKSWHDQRTGQAFSEDFSISTHVAAMRSEFDQDERDFLAAAAARCGALEPGEVYGFFPALQMGGAYKVENLKRVRAAEHFVFLAQLGPFHLTRLTPPDPPAYPFGHIVPVRVIGKPDKR